MSSALKIICCMAVSTVIVGLGSQASRLSQADRSLAAPSANGSSVMLTAFEPEPNAPPVITQGSGTR